MLFEIFTAAHGKSGGVVLASGRMRKVFWLVSEALDSLLVWVVIAIRRSLSLIGRPGFLLVSISIGAIICLLLTHQLVGEASLVDVVVALVWLGSIHFALGVEVVRLMHALLTLNGLLGLRRHVPLSQGVCAVPRLRSDVLLHLLLETIRASIGVLTVLIDDTLVVLLVIDLWLELWLAFAAHVLEVSAVLVNN